MTTPTPLLTPLKKGPWNLPTRVALAPLTRGRATDDFIPTDIMVEYYSQRTDAFQITEATGISKQGLGWFKAPGIWNNKQIEAWKRVTKAVHKKNGIIGLQMWQMGRQAHTRITGERRIVSASPLRLNDVVTTKPSNEDLAKGIYKQSVKMDFQVPYPLLNEFGKHGHDDFEDKTYHATIRQVVKDYGQAAKNAMTAGFDFVEIHGANGYLIDQFIQSCSNKRNDHYGGSIFNRLRFMREVVFEVVKQVGDCQRVGIRLSPNGNFAGQGSPDNLETFDAAIEWLSTQKIGYIHLMDGLTFGFHNKCPAYTLKRARGIIDKFNTDSSKPTLLMGNVGYDKKTADKAIGDGYADLIAFGRPYISNPDMIYRFQNNFDLNPLAEYEDWWGIGKGPNGYITWPYHPSNSQQNEYLKRSKL